MALGLSLHIGINSISRSAYRNTRYSTLKGCHNDALAFQAIARRKGFHVMAVLLDRAATFATVESLIRSAAQLLENGGTCLLTFSGHGVQQCDAEPGFRDSGGREEGAYNECLVLYDRLMKDDYLHGLLAQFCAGAHVIFVCDSCHSCSMYELTPRRSRPYRVSPPAGYIRRGGTRPKLIDPADARHHLTRFRKTYSVLDKRYAATSQRSLQAEILVISACEDDETARDGAVNSAFMQTLLIVMANWNVDVRHRKNGGYDEFVDEIRHNLHPFQHPCLTKMGGTTNSSFFAGPPFSIH